MNHAASKSVRRDKNKDRRLDFLRSPLHLQMVFCVLCIVAAIFLKFFLPAWFQTAGFEYRSLFDPSEVDEPPVKFASALLDAFFVPANAAAAAPEGCSNETYLPKQNAVLPVQEFYLSSGYGWRVHPIRGEKSFHNGVDLACAEGTPISAAMDGMVHATGFDSLNGNYIILRHSDGVVTSYCHMQFVFARAGEFVQAGEPIGTVGQTGSATGPHLHFCLKHNGVRYDPSEMLKL